MFLWVFTLGFWNSKDSFKTLLWKYITISLGHEVISWIKAGSFSCRRVFPKAVTSFKLMMTEILAVLEILVNLILKSHLWQHCHLQTFTEHVLHVGQRAGPGDTACVKYNHVLRDVRVTLGSKAKYRKSKNVLFLTLYFNILDVVIKIKNLVYLVSFTF